MESVEPSSVDRFLWRHGQELLDSRIFRSDNARHLTGGWGQISVAVGLFILAAFIGGDLAIYPLCAGTIATLIGVLSLRAEFSRPHHPTSVGSQIVAPTPEGQRLVHRICSHIGYYNYQQEIQGRSLVRVRGLRTASQVLRQDLFDLLEAAAYEFNRVDGLLQERSSLSDPAIRALGPTSRVAALEAMAVILNHAVWIDTFPENASDHIATIRQKTERLKHLADKLSTHVSSRPSVLESLASRTLIDDVIDKLALEEEARYELLPDDLDAKS